MLFRKTDHKPVTETAREEDLGKDGAKDEAEKEEALGLELVRCIGGGLHC